MKYKVYYSKSAFVPNSPEIEIEASNAKSAAEIFQSRFPAKHAKIITVDPIGFVGIFSGLSFFENTDFDPNAKSADGLGLKADNLVENQILGGEYNTESTLQEILEVQRKQLYWIRIIGIPFMLSAIITAIYLIAGTFK